MSQSKKETQIKRKFHLVIKTIVMGPYQVLASTKLVVKRIKVLIVKIKRINHNNQRLSNNNNYRNYNNN